MRQANKNDIDSGSACWRKHSGGLCPVPPTQRVTVRYRNGEVSEAIMASERRWESWPASVGESDWDIVAFRATASET
jgi:hypothetical protein